MFYNVERIGEIDKCIKAVTRSVFHFILLPDPFRQGRIISGVPAGAMGLETQLTTDKAGAVVKKNSGAGFYRAKCFVGGKL